MVKYLLNDLFGSLSDATRRDMLQRLSGGELTISQLAATYSMSLPAVSKHLRVLEASGLITKEKHGRQWFVRLTPAAFKNATDHLQQYEAILHNRLDSLSAYLQQKPQVSRQKVAPLPLSSQQPIMVTNVCEGDPASVWRAYIIPACIMQWWVSPGIQLLAVENNVEVGGSWRFTLRGADGHDYILSGTYSAVEYPHRLEYTEGVGEPDTSRPEAQVTIIFEPLTGNKTLLTRKSLARPAVHQLNAAWLRMVGGG